MGARARARVALAGAVLGFLASHCGSDDRAAEAQDAGPETPDELYVGYANVTLPWRAGAKPGQVGTAALPERDQLLANSVGELLPILQPAMLDPAALARDMTAWQMRQLEDRVAQTMPGRYNALFEPGDGVELPPNVKVLVVRRGAEKVALIRADLYIMHEQLQRRVADMVEARTGLTRDRLFMVATHNHSVPHYVSAAPGVWILAEAFDPRQFVYVSQRIASAIIEADENLEAAELRAVKTEFRDVQRNIIGPGTSAVMNPDGVAEMVPVGYPRDYFDEDLLMLRFDRPGGGSTIASLFIFGMHPESLPSGHGITSGEWPTHTESKLEERLGSPFLWLPGPLGDCEPDDGFLNPDHVFWRASFEAMDRMSEIISSAVQAAFTAAGDEPGDTKPRVAQIARDIPGTADFPLPTSEYLGDGFRLPMLRLIEDSAVYRLHVVRLGDALLLGAPAEITTDLALNIKSRVDREPDNVYQGYEWPEAPAWVKDRVRGNFDTTEVAVEHGATLPMAVSHANGYMGYIVTAWEYESHSHYREDMTALGPGTADHVATAFVKMADELAGGASFTPALPDWRDADLEGVEQVSTFLAGLEARVADLSRALPASDPSIVGTVVTQPSNAMVGGTPSFSWMGGTNDLDPPRALIERQNGDRWEPVASGPSGELFVLFESPAIWTAVWRRASEGAGLRFRVEGTYRGAEAGASPADPIWDPDGKNQNYELASATFSVSPP